MKPLDSAIFASAVLVRFLFRSSNPAHRRNPEKRDTRRFGGGTFWRSSGDEGGFCVHKRQLHSAAIVLRPITCFAFEWESTRFGKKIKNINLKSADFTKDNENAIILLALSVSEKRRSTEAKGAEVQ